MTTGSCPDGECTKLHLQGKDLNDCVWEEQQVARAGSGFHRIRMERMYLMESEGPLIGRWIYVITARILRECVVAWERLLGSVHTKGKALERRLDFLTELNPWEYVRASQQPKQKHQKPLESPCGYSFQNFHPKGHMVSCANRLCALFLSLIFMEEMVHIQGPVMRVLAPA